MKKLPSLTIALMIVGVATGSEGVIKRAAAQDNGCQATIQTIRSDIINRHGGSVYQLQESQIQDHPLSPYKQKGEIHFSLGGNRSLSSRRSQRSADIMNSEKLLADYSDRIIRSCDDIVRVAFNLAQTDWIIRFSWIDGKYTRMDECLEPRRDIEYNLKWGQDVCL